MLLSESQLETPRPSNLSRIVACHGSRRLVAQVPKSPSSSYADEGTAAHHIGEQCLTLGRSPVEYFGQHIHVNGKDWLANTNMITAVCKYVDYVQRDRKNLGPGAVMHIERKLFLPDINNGGMVDCLLVHPAHGRVHVHDYKHGEGVYVSEVWNAQFLAYGVAGALAMFPSVPLNLIEFQFTVHQPRFPGQAPSRSQTLPGSAVQGWRDDVLRPALEAGRKPDAPLVAGDHCQFCDAKKICMAYLSAPKKPYQKAPIKPDAIPSGFVF